MTDIELRAIACGYGPIVGPIIESFGFCAGNAQPHAEQHRSATASTRTTGRSARVPVRARPHQGYEHVHHGPGGP